MNEPTTRLTTRRSGSQAHPGATTSDEPFLLRVETALLYALSITAFVVMWWRTMP